MKFINRKFVWLILSLIVFSLQANAQEKTFDESILSDKGKQAYQTLLKVDLFALFGISYSGETSKGELALDDLLKEKESTNALKNLIKTATPEGGLYALLGLKMLNCKCFKEELENFKKLPEPLARKNSGRDIEKGNVRRMQGCIGFQESRLKVAQDIETEKELPIKVKISNYKAEKQSEQKSN